MQIFIDETGQFTPSSGWSAVCSIALPDKEVGRTRRELSFLTRDWPRANNGELKGGILEKKHLEALVNVLFKNDCIMQAYAIDMAAEDSEKLRAPQRGQCEGMTANLTPEHKESLIESVWDLRKTLERMPTQLYVQSVLMTLLMDEIVEKISMYFCQRRPRELSSFAWTIDAKDPTKITTQEN